MTGKVLNTLTDASLSQKVYEDGRSLGFLGWHLTQTLGEMLGLVGLKIDAPGFDLSVWPQPKKSRRHTRKQPHR